MIKYGWAVVAAGIFPYSLMVPQSPGNPDADAYVGQPGSVYDASANPARTIGVVTYNPMAPLPADSNGPTAAPIFPAPTPPPATPAPMRNR